jgi:hypothetical protein
MISRRAFVCSLQRAQHLVEEVGEVGREVVWQVGEAEAFERLRGGAADLRAID